MPLNQIHFPTKDKIASYSRLIEDAGEADVCYGGIGWCGHIAFWEAHLGFEFGADLAAYKKAGARLVELHPMTIMQNALHSFGGDWSWVPPKANSIGPRDILGARDRSFRLDGYQGGGARAGEYAGSRINPPGGSRNLHDSGRRSGQC
jgi:glucosamine-6-phosphate deaminase